MSRRVRSVVLSAAMAAGLMAAGAAGAATFTNGSFENASVDPGSSFVTLLAGSTAIDGWTVQPESIDYIGGSWDYPTASYLRRAEIWNAHRNLECSPQLRSRILLFPSKRSRSSSRSAQNCQLVWPREGRVH